MFPSAGVRCGGERRKKEKLASDSFVARLAQKTRLKSPPKSYAYRPLLALPQIKLWLPVMTRKSKREVAPPPLQAGSMAAPRWPGTVSSVVPPSGAAMAPPPGWWTGPGTASGACWGAAPTPLCHGDSDPFNIEGLSSRSSDCGMDHPPARGYLIQNDHNLFPAPWAPACNMIICRLHSLIQALSMLHRVRKINPSPT
uniref:Uncharacterized protein n=1 Tax=Arundo donax TaxID=35708 RepID=A0A0A9F9W9_ARUDO